MVQLRDIDIYIDKLHVCHHAFSNALFASCAFYFTVLHFILTTGHLLDQDLIRSSLITWQLLNIDISATALRPFPRRQFVGTINMRCTEVQNDCRHRVAAHGLWSYVNTAKLLLSQSITGCQFLSQLLISLYWSTDAQSALVLQTCSRLNWRTK